jgi:hypothetical protein
VGPADLNRRRTKSILGEDTGHRAALGEPHDEKVFPARLPNAGTHHGERDPRHREQRGSIGWRELNGH